MTSSYSLLPLRRAATRALFHTLVFALAGCAAVHRPPTTIPALLADADGSRRAERALRDTVVARLARRAVRSADHTVNVLLLSGGGQNGAYGVGFVRGWRARTDAPMPPFDLITAISTGALQAPFILLGSTAAVDTLTSLYRNSAERIAPSIDWWFWLRKTGGLVNTTRCDASIASVVDSTFRDSLRTQFAKDRQVVFGTTDLDIGTGRTWDLGTALDGSEGLVRTRTLLKAATSLFDMAWMQKLEDLGTTRARSTKPWDLIDSPYSRPLPQTP